MANIKSAKKRVIVNRTKAERNKAIRSEVKTSIKKVEAAVAAKDLAAAQAALKVATATIESACYTTKTTLQEKFPAYPKQLTLLLNSN